jgi:hypothetical protein
LKRLFTLGFVVMLAAAFTAAWSSPIANAAPLPKVTVTLDATDCSSIVVTGDWTPVAGQFEAAVSLTDQTTNQNETDTDFSITSSSSHVTFTMPNGIALPSGAKNHRFLAEITIIDSTGGAGGILADGSVKLNGPNALSCGLFPS